MNTRPFDELSDAAWEDMAAAGPVHARPLRVFARLPEGADAATVVFDDPARHAQRFEAGQVLTLEAVIDGERVRRAYSLATGSSDGALAITVKRVPGGKMSNWIHDRLGEGVLVRCFGPSGHFTAGPPPSPGPRRLLPVVGGSGIVPLQAVARQVLHDEPQAEVTLVYGSSALERAFFAAALQQRVRDDAPCLRLHWVFESAPAEGCGQAITLPPGDTLLEAALTAGIAPPFSCRSGGCRACRVRITDQLQHVALDEPNAVRPDDLARGEVPACLVRPNGPCRFRLP